VTGTSYAAAAIWQYETLRRLVKQKRRQAARNDGFYISKAGDFRHRLTAWWNDLFSGKKLECGIIGINYAVFLA